MNTTETPTLSNEHYEILHHTEHRAAGGRYCGGGKHMDELVQMGLMLFIGKPAWCDDPFYTITSKGVRALRERAQTPTPSAQQP